jgi:hypothetical protein
MQAPGSLRQRGEATSRVGASAVTLGRRTREPFRDRAARTPMTLERYLRLVAGVMVMLSLALTRWVDPRFVYLTLFVGANLFQSALTDWCPLVPILGKLGVRRGASATT